VTVDEDRVWLAVAAAFDVMIPAWPKRASRFPAAV
jgi:hypothetical protein